MGKNFTTTIRLEGGGKNFQGKAPTLKDQIKEQGIDLEKFLKGEPQKEVFQTEGTNNNAELTSFVLENLDDFRNQKITAKKLAGSIYSFFNSDNNSKNPKYTNRDEQLKRLFAVLTPLNKSSKLSNEEMISLTAGYFAIETFKESLEKEKKGETTMHGNKNRVRPGNLGVDTETRKGLPANFQFSSMGEGITEVGAMTDDEI